MHVKYDSLNFGFDETLKMLQEQVNRFAADEIAPRAAEIDSSNNF